MTDLIERLQAASHDERLSTGMLYREAADELERLYRELAAMQHGGVCIWCGEALDLTGNDMGAAVEWARKHDASCPVNPLRRELAEARERALKQAEVLLAVTMQRDEARGLLSETRTCQSVNDYVELSRRIDAFLTPSATPETR